MLHVDRDNLNFAAIYMAVDPTGKCYVGQTVKFGKRYCSYRCYFRGHNPPPWISDLRHAGYTIDDVDFYILEYIDDISKLDEREIFWIAKMHSNDPEFGHNLTKGGSGPPGRYRRHKNPYMRKEHFENSYILYDVVTDDVCFLLTAHSLLAELRSRSDGKTSMKDAACLATTGKSYYDRFYVYFADPVKRRESVNHIYFNKMPYLRKITPDNYKHYLGALNMLMKQIRAYQRCEKKLVMNYIDSGCVDEYSFRSYCLYDEYYNDLDEFRQQLTSEIRDFNYILYNRKEQTSKAYAAIPAKRLKRIVKNGRRPDASDFKFYDSLTEIANDLKIYRKGLDARLNYPAPISRHFIYVTDKTDGEQILKNMKTIEIPKVYKDEVDKFSYMQGYFMLHNIVLSQG